MRPARVPLTRRWRRFHLRHPWLRTLLVVAVGLALLDGVRGLAASVDAEPTGVDTVAARPLERGRRLTAGDLTTAPARPGGPRAVADPVGRVVTAPILAGEPVVDARLAPAGVEGVAALVPPGRRAVAVPVTLAAPPVLEGDRVDVYVADESALLTGQATRIARDAVVVAVGDDQVTVAVRGDEAARLSGGLAAGTVTLALSGAEP